MTDAMLSSMCWLCRRETEILRYNHAPDSRPTLFRDITFSQVAGVEGQASISPIITSPKQPIPRGAARRTKLSSPCSRKTDHELVLDPVYDPSTHTWTFRVHADCWDLVACRVSNTIACATAWCKALISLNWNLGPFPSAPSTHETPKLILGPAPSCKKNYRRLSLEQLDNFDGLATELGLERLPTVVHQTVTLQDLGLATSPQEHHRRPQTGNDTFASLPDEILQQIIQFTSTSDLSNLRLASKTIAHISRLDALPRSFWFSRFAPPFEMGFALPKQYDRDLDWRALYFLIRRARLWNMIPLPRTDSCLARLAKRGYWWERLSVIPELYSVSVTGRQLEGAPLARQMLRPSTQEGTARCGAAQKSRDEPQWSATGKRLLSLKTRLPLSSHCGPNKSIVGLQRCCVG